MSNSVIKDGSGKGYSAAVTSKNQLSTVSVGVEEVTHISSTEEGAYVVNFERTISSGGSTEYIGHFQYTGQYKFQVESIRIFREDVALESGSQGWVEIIGNTTYTSGGTAVTPLNVNLGSSNSLTSVTYSGASTLTIDDSDVISLGKLVVRDDLTIDPNGAFIFNKNDQISIRGTSKSTGDILRVNILGFEVKEII